MAALDPFTAAVMDAGRRAEHAQKLRDIAATCGYRLAYKPRTSRMHRSKKPWSLRYSDGTLCASFNTLDQLERNMRGRCAA